MTDVFYDEKRGGEKMYKLIIMKERTDTHIADLVDDYVKVQSLALQKKKEEAIAKWSKNKIGDTYIKISEDFLKNVPLRKTGKRNPKLMSDAVAVDHLASKFQELKSEIGKVIIGQENAIDYVLLSVFCGGHSLLIGVPGLAKTLLVHTVSDALGLHFKRIQFTPDLMPSDILGSEILDKNREFTFIKGPIFFQYDTGRRDQQNPTKNPSSPVRSHARKIGYYCWSLLSVRAPFSRLSHTKSY